MNSIKRIKQPVHWRPQLVLLNYSSPQLCLFVAIGKNIKGVSFDTQMTAKYSIVISGGPEMSSESLNAELSKKTSVFGLKLWVLIGLSVGVFIISILCALSVWVTFRRKSRRSLDKYAHSKIPNISKDIKVDRVGVQNLSDHPESLFLKVNDKSSGRNSEKMLVHLGMSKSSDPDNASQCSSIYHHERACSSHSGEEGSSGTFRKQSSLSHAGLVTASPLIGLPEFSHLGWGHWFTLRDLEFATNSFAAENVLGEGGYGVVYMGRLINGTEVAVKKLLNNLMLVYEYVNNGNLEQWLHGGMHHHGILTWEARMKVLLGTAKALAYLHEAIEPKVVHRDIKSSNILIDDDFYLVHITCIWQVNLLEWLKMMVGTRRAEEVVDPNLEVKPTTRALKRALLVALRCVDPDAERRPKMTQVVRMLEADEYPLREYLRAHEFDLYNPLQDRRNRKTRTTSMEIESMREESTESETKVVVDSESRSAETTHGKDWRAL
ncbi:hypothetical protein SADUNF_Sadunf02G0049500 [Salix dunnii]|uniref:non-specific serine/threonine protein kinase n=1 Tax=Salix dunnii TaxID=1413687 RepID=A0A835N655_9ROSI|nr:hypothetical protein SADUNF_Sadunf02G0049500 [Salix dunnii]